MIRKLKEIQTSSPQKLGKFLALQAEETVGEVKNETPVDTGALKGGWHRESTKEFTQTIYNDVEYVKHVEYGHRIGKTKVKVKPGVYMLKKTINTRESKFYRDLRIAFKEVFK